jgi:3-oxoacyl-[acyl-carrier-protein] synthase II
MTRRVVVTGLGTISPVGNTIGEAWSAVCDGRSGIRAIEAYDVSAYPTRIAGTIINFDAGQWMSPKDVKRTDPFIHFGVAAAKQALTDSGIDVTEANRERIGVCVGSGIGGIGTIESECAILHKSGPRRLSPFFVPSSIINMISGYISIDLGITGPNLATVSACTTGAHAIGVAYRMIQYGDADIFIAGGAEYGSAPAGLAGFCQARAMTTRNDDPTAASRPFDAGRDGFVLGDGAGVVVLETLESAQARGARIYAEIVGFGMSGDASHITLPPDDGNGARRAMQNAMKDARINPEQVDYINAHGTSTPAGDVAETVAIKDAFGDYARKVMVSSTKSVTGHLLGAAGGIEAVFSVLALHDQIVPPTMNLTDPDPRCDLDYVPHTARRVPLEYVLSNSFGFGGTNGSLAFRRFA